MILMIHQYQRIWTRLELSLRALMVILCVFVVFDLMCLEIPNKFIIYLLLLMLVKYKPMHQSIFCMHLCEIKSESKYTHLPAYWFIISNDNCIIFKEIYMIIILSFFYTFIHCITQFSPNQQYLSLCMWWLCFVQEHF